MSEINVTPMEKGMLEIACDGIKYEVQGEEFHHLYHDRAVVVRHQDKWTLYTNAYTNVGDYPYWFGGVYKLLDDILEYKCVEAAFAYRTENGWYFLNFIHALWYIDRESVRELRANNFLRLGDNLTSLEKCGGFKNGPNANEHDAYIYGYAVEVDGNKYLVYNCNMGVYNVCNYELVQFHKYVPIKGYANLAKVYLRPNTKKFVIATLANEGGSNYSEEASKIIKVSDSFWMLQQGKKTALYGITKEDNFVGRIVAMTQDPISIHKIYNQHIRVSVGNSDKRLYDTFGLICHE